MLDINLPRNPFFCFCLAILLAASGCVSYNRDAFLASHSLDKFMADRPQAARMLRQHPALEQWLRVEWNRPINDCRIFWNNEQPSDSSTAEHCPSLKYHLIVIHVSKKLAPVDQLLALSFETCNAQGRAGFDAITAQAIAGKITREQYIHEIDEREYAAVLRIKENFPALLPLTANEIAATDLYRKLLQVPPTFKDYQAWRIRASNAVYLQTQKLYGKEYDQLANKKANP
jgi:hypothetical protein